MCVQFNRDLSRDVREVTPETMERLCRYPGRSSIREVAGRRGSGRCCATAGQSLVPAFLPESLGGPRTSLALTADGRGYCRVGAAFSGRMEAGSKLIYQEAHRSLDGVLLPLVLGRPRATSSNAAGSWGSRGRRSGSGAPRLEPYPI